METRIPIWINGVLNSLVVELRVGNGMLSVSHSDRLVFQDEATYAKYIFTVLGVCLGYLEKDRIPRIELTHRLDIDLGQDKAAVPDPELDDTDRQILAGLSMVPRLSWRKLSVDLQLSDDDMRSRVECLESRGLICLFKTYDGWRQIHSYDITDTGREALKGGANDGS